MAPIKFEEQLKDKLEKRTLSPSSESWSKLSERLDADDKKSKKPIFWWLSIAAGVLLMVALSVQFFNGDDADKVIPKVVEKEGVIIPIETLKPDLKTIDDVQLVIEEQEIKEKKESPEILEKHSIRNSKREAQNALKIETKLAEQNNTTPEEVLNIEARNLLNEAMIKDAVTVALDELKSENTLVTEREIDSLLKTASKEIFKDKLRKETPKTVDASALLKSVEDDMGQSFRTKVFDALKESYETVKTAVAERNN